MAKRLYTLSLKIDAKIIALMKLKVVCLKFKQTSQVVSETFGHLLTIKQVTCIEFKLKSKRQMDASGKRLFSKALPLGRTVIALSDLGLRSGENDCVEKMISIHKYPEKENTGGSSGQGYANIRSTLPARIESCIFSCYCCHRNREI